jgi:uncharacterized Zn finger protein
MSDKGTRDAGSPFTSMDMTCPTCGEQMRPRQLRSGSLVLRCRACGQVAVL